jgi:hypothetical protein
LSESGLLGGHLLSRVEIDMAVTQDRTQAKKGPDKVIARPTPPQANVVTQGAEILSWSRRVDVRKKAAS